MFFGACRRVTFFRAALEGECFRNLLTLEGLPKFANPLTSTVPNYLEPGKGAGWQCEPKPPLAL